MKPFITFSSDFGLRDNYVASVKAVILSQLPETILLDITHELPPFAPSMALPHLLDILELCPRGTLHLVVVDPGVGGPRRAVLGLSPLFSILFPDNGLPSLFATWVEKLRFVNITNLSLFAGVASPTFQGRDLFAPAAIYLGQGRDPWLLGPEIPADSLERTGGNNNPDGKILAWNVDRFGNILLGYRVTHRPEIVTLCNKGNPIPYVTRYQEVRPGQLGILVNSSRWLEIFCREGSASSMTRILAGDRINIRIEGGEGRVLI